MCAMESPTQKFGYLDVKQSGKVKGRKLKNWKRRWVVLTKMTDMASDQVVAKIDLYENETIWKSSRCEKITFVLDNVTSIEKTKSRTRPFAFEVAQRHPELVFSGASEIDSFSWILTLQQIFTPHLVKAKKESYHVTVQANVDSSRWHLSGQYCLAISPSGISLNDLDTGNCYITWGLSTLMRFNLTKNSTSGDLDVLSIECGRNGPTGESTFEFVSEEASDILQTIRQSICHALSQKQTTRQMNVPTRPRSASESNSEKQFKNILDSSPIGIEVSDRFRSESESSSCTMTPTSPHIPGIPFVKESQLPLNPNKSPVFPSRLSNTELESLNETEEHDCEKHLDRCNESCDGFTERTQAITSHHRYSSLPIRIAKAEDPGYSVIRDTDNTETRGRRNTFSTDDTEKNTHAATPDIFHLPPRRKRADAMIISSKRTVSFEKEDEDPSDIDSAISSLNLSSSWDSAKVKGEQLMRLILGKPGETKDESDPESPPPPGRLNRRRSSSTPDLPAFWKHQASLENVYEELDPIKSAALRPNLPSSLDVPPALPARPYSIVVPMPRFENTQKIVRFKKSFFSNKPKLKRGKSLLALGESKGCSCNYPYISSKGILLSKENDSVCAQCGGSVDVKDCNNVNSKLDNSSNGSSTDSSLNDIYSKISDVKEAPLIRRRRSSDIGRHLVLNSVEPSKRKKKDKQKFYSLRRDGSHKTNKTPIERSNNFDDFMNREWSESIENLQLSSRRLSGCSRNDPLISFFLDDENFESNPMVTGQLAETRRMSSSSDLLMSPDTPKQLSPLEFLNGPIFDSSKEKPISNQMSSPSLLSSTNGNFDHFGLDPFAITPNQHINGVAYTSLRVPELNPHPNFNHSHHTTQISPMNGHTSPNAFNSPLKPLMSQAANTANKQNVSPSLQSSPSDTSLTSCNSLYLSMNTTNIQRSITTNASSPLSENSTPQIHSSAFNPTNVNNNEVKPQDILDDLDLFGFNERNKQSGTFQTLDSPTSHDVYVSPGNMQPQQQYKWPNFVDFLTNN